ncbi:MAG: ATP-binding protein, partial [Lachnospiraceae bacterium]|nr:ATP-binding protein [Lachnospiraceae bacterium]
MAAKKGSLSINSENIFPIIKKWLYSDHDIFVRELISNGCDAITKLKKLEMMGEYEAPLDYKPRINVIVSPEKKTMTFTDNGLGMTADEVEEYINQIAFSGATDFIEKYKDKANDDQIIGHFGLGFYSAFMVSDRVTIDTLSYQKDAKPVHWECDGGTEFTMDEGDKAEVGTTITLYLNEDCLEFANEYRAREVLKKYCSFMPTEIYLYSEKQFKEEQEELAKKAEEASTEGSASEGEG